MRTFSRPTSEIYWPRHRGPGCPDADTLFYRISASSRNIFFSDARGIHARTPPSSFSLAARMRSSHTRKKCFFFALLSRKTRILPALLILQVVFALYVRPSNLRNLPSFFFLGSASAVFLHRCCWRSALYPRDADGRGCAGGLGTRSAHYATYNVAGPTSSPRLSIRNPVSRTQNTSTQKVSLATLESLAHQVSFWLAHRRERRERER